MAKQAVAVKDRIEQRIRRGDTVIVRKGREAGKSGKVIRVLRQKDAVLVQGLNYVKKHTRPNPQIGRQGGVMEKESMIRMPNVMVVCPQCEAPTRVARKTIEDGKRVRECKKCSYQF